MPLAPLVAALALGMVHLLAGRLNVVTQLARGGWLSFAGGVAVAYVFVRLLPEVAEAEATIRRAVPPLLGFFEHHAYLIALLGLVVFYGLERTAQVSRRERRRAQQADSTSAGVFWLHVGAFAVYNALVGYLLVHRVDPDPRGLSLFFLAMALHFVVNDHALREHHQAPYDRLGRWLLAGAVLLGWAIGAVTEIAEAALAVLTGFLAGGVILNVLKEELPAERDSRFGQFALGTAAYAALLLTL